MITEYKRPNTLEEALQLLSQPNAYPLGGGTVLTKQNDRAIIAVDLQSLGLDQIRKMGEKLEIGAATTLSQLLEAVTTPRSAPLGSVVPSPAFREAILLETPLNLRNMGTVAGTLVTCDGRSHFTTAMLALDARLTVQGPSPAVHGLGDFLLTRSTLSHGSLITKIEIPLNIRFSFESVARTPKDSPIVCVALAQWPSGRTRLALGGFGAAPVLALDGNEPGGVEEAARNAFAEAGDEWATAEYRREIAAVLAKRCLEG
jgi:CO/xanthine dehydrogenase FAD-binding subunit